MTNQPDVTAILTGHSEGLMAGPAARSLLEAVKHAGDIGISCEIIAVLDRADALTKGVVRKAFGDNATYIESSAGDPAGARNAGIGAAKGRYACFLDADDLWSENWITESYTAAEERPDAVFHSACNIIFGGNHFIFWHIDSESPHCDPDYLDFRNYWDALCFAKLEIFRRFPFRLNDLASGFGHEDWLWNAVTVDAGIPHKPVPGTIHFKRARPGSQMEKVDELGGVRFPVDETTLRC